MSISQDSFYRELTDEEKVRAQKGRFNFDHPDAFDENLMYRTMKDILDGKKVTINMYDYRTNSLSPSQTMTIYPADVVLFEGILVFYFRAIRELFHMKLFVDTDSDTRLARRVPRDINERGRDLDQVLNQYMLFVKPAFEEFCSPTKKFADVIIPRGADNTGKLRFSFFAFARMTFKNLALDTFLGRQALNHRCKLIDTQNRYSVMQNATGRGLGNDVQC